MSAGLHALLAGSAPEVAPRLLGWLLESRGREGTVTVELTEVEAYAGRSDPASHAYRGPTPRNEVMFGPAGRLYVYLSYGMHWCANVVTGPEGEASAVLLRAGRVVEGVELARLRRGERVPERHLARGPACVTRALGIEKAYNGLDLVCGDALRLSPPAACVASVGTILRSQEHRQRNIVPTEQVDGWALVSDKARAVSSGPRVGVSQAAELPWRFWVTGEASVSTYRRSPRAPLPASITP